MEMMVVVGWGCGGAGRSGEGGEMQGDVKGAPVQGHWRLLNRGSLAARSTPLRLMSADASHPHGCCQPSCLMVHLSKLPGPA
jgi:hypothetical protein